MNASRKSFVDVFSSGFGMVPPTLLTTMSSLPNASTAAAASSAVVLGVGEVADDDVRAPARWPGSASATVVELGLGAGGDDDVGADFGECHRDRGTEAAARAGDHCQPDRRAGTCRGSRVPLFPRRATP